MRHHALVCAALLACVYTPTALGVPQFAFGCDSSYGIFLTLPLLLLKQVSITLP